ncbi:right-handed parallel beta-helix repeat-containing protein [Mycobacterium sp. SMC-4]|uniref:right-handed parallel beta-helix repeat-containing protein n=1 Tax=Mycobacterium sp. SMC-4 TaxID=2857059 RepID=UPI003D039B87
MAYADDSVGSSRTTSSASADRTSTTATARDSKSSEGESSDASKGPQRTSAGDATADSGTVDDGEAAGSVTTDDDPKSEQVVGDASDRAESVDEADEDVKAEDEAASENAVDSPQAPTAAAANGSKAKSSRAARNATSVEDADIDDASSTKERATATIRDTPEPDEDLAADTPKSVEADATPRAAAARAEVVSSTGAAATNLTAPSTVVPGTTTQEVELASAAVALEPAAPSTLADILREFMLRIQRTYFNKPPTAKPVQNPGQSSGSTVTGTVGARDPDDDPVEVELSEGPKAGSVQVNPDGTYTYTPSADLAAAGGTDTFTVTIRETNADSHYHGLNDLLSTMVRSLTGAAGKPDDSGTVVQKITVTIAKATNVVTPNPGEGEQNPPTGTLPPGDPGATPPNKYDAGLSDPFQLPDASTGKKLNVRDYGATSGRSSDDDGSAIQRAVNAAQAGDTVYIPKGTYHIRSTIKLKSGVSLIGESREDTVLAGNSLWSSPHAMIYAPPGVTNLTISSFTITKASGMSFKAGVRLGSEGDGALVSRIVVKDLFVEKFQRFGIQLQNAYQVLVDGNVVRNATALGGGGSGYGIMIDQSRSSNNWIRNNEVGPVIRHAILVQSAHHNLIEHNRITGAVSGAIDLHGEDEYSNEIRYNTISDCVPNGTSISPNGAGIEVGEFSGVIGSTTKHDNSGPMNWIHHNVVYNCACGVRVVNNSNHTYIEDNVFYDNWGSGILADLAPLKNLYISGNEIYNNKGNGITLHDVSEAVLEDNIIRDNGRYGIWTNAGVTDYEIVGNTLTDNRLGDVVLGSPDGVFESVATAL